MVLLNVVLMGLIGATLVGVLVWSIWTQHRHHGCADLRIRRRLQISVKLVTPDQPELAVGSSVVTQI